MRGLTVIQPWATLLATRQKEYETRSWTQNRYRGLVAIHASKNWPDQCRRLCADEPFATALAAGIPAYTPEHEPGLDWFLQHTPGYILAVGDLESIVPTDNLFLRGYERHFGDFTPGRFAWRFANVRRLKQPIPARGMQGLWNITPENERQILSQL